MEEKRELSSPKKKLSDTQFELMKVQNKYILTLFSMGFFGAAQGCGGGQKAPLPKILHTYPTTMKLGMVIPNSNKIQKIYERRDTLFEVCYHKHFLPEIRKSCYIK